MTREEKIEIQRKEITAFLGYFKNNKLDMNNSKIMDRMQLAITRIFQLEIQELGYTFDIDDNSQNTFRLEFVNDASSSWRGACGSGASMQDGKFVQLKPRIAYNVANLYSGLANSDQNARMLECKKIFKTVFHEIQHHRQYLMARTNVSSKEAMLYARDMAVRPYISKEWYSRDEKTGNYEQYAMENNANEVGYRQYLEIMGISDSEISDLRDIERGKFYIERYKADVDSWDGKSHYDSNGLQERDDVTIPILDSIICNKGETDILVKYPILQKEYNLDGTKKTSIELINNMKSEKQKILQDTSLSDNEKKTLIKDGKEMYYELIYRQLEKSTPEQITEISNIIGKDESKAILEDMIYYFSCQKEYRLVESANMAMALKNKGEYGFIMPYNSGKIEVEQNGESIQMTCEEFIKTIDPQLLQKKFIIPHGKEKGEMSAERFIERYCFKNLPQSGILTLKDGTKISAKQFVEQYMLQMKELKKDYPPIKFIMDTIQSDTPWAIQQAHCDRLNSYYEEKKDVLKQISKKIEDPTKQVEVKQNSEKTSKQQLMQEQLDRKMQWIRSFLTVYDAVETQNQYDIRKKDEDSNMLQVLNGIDNNEFVGEGLSNIDLSYYQNNKEYDIERVIPKIARLLKSADNLTIDGGRNYLEEFSNIPNINAILLQIKNSQSVQNMLTQAQENIKNGNLPQHRKTRAEIDKTLAQDYLKSDKRSKPTIKEELAYRASTIDGAQERVVYAGVKSINDIPIDVKQKTAVERVIARQNKKVPSGVILKNGSFVFVVDTQKEIKKDMNDRNFYDEVYITPKDSSDITVREKIRIQEMRDVSEEMRKFQNKELEKTNMNKVK